MEPQGVQVPGKARPLAVRCAVLVLAVALGLGLQHLLRSRLDEIQALAGSDVIQARAQLAGILRGVAVVVFGSTGALGMAMFASGRRAAREGRFPPSGAWSWGAARIVSGPRARSLARASMALAVALVLLSAAGAAVTWHVASVLLACRAT